MNNFCWKCQKEFNTVIHFKTICEKCFAYLHCCQGCRFYQEGKPNDCQIPGTEQVRDREANNYCEEFKPVKERTRARGANIKDISNRLFND